jgi:hypothetical protein
VVFAFTLDKELQSWTFEFETVEVAEEWVKQVEFQKQSQNTREKDFRAVNKSIVEIARKEQEYANDIVKEEQRDVPIDESRIMGLMVGLTKSKVSIPQESRFRTQAQNSHADNPDDWNHKFYQHRSIQTLFLFKNLAADTFF